MYSPYRTHTTTSYSPSKPSLKAKGDKTVLSAYKPKNNKYFTLLHRALRGEFLSSTERFCLSGLIIFLALQMIAVWVFHQNLWMTYQPQAPLTSEPPANVWVEDTLLDNAG